MDHELLYAASATSDKVFDMAGYACATFALICLLYLFFGGNGNDPGAGLES